MPQPLSKVKKISYVGYGPMTMLLEPEMSISVARVIASWAMTEMQQARLLALFLKSEMKVGVSMFLGVISAEAKKAMLDEAAKASLNSTDYDLYALVNRAIAPVRRRRNEYVHGVWGNSADLPNYLLWLPPEEFLLRDTAMHEARLRGDREALKALAEQLNPKTMAYSRQDMGEDINRANQATTCVQDLVVALSGLGPKSDEARKSLSASPLVRAVGGNQSHQTSP